MGRFLTAFLLVGLVNVGFGQNLYHAIRNYTAVDGLPQSQVTSLVEDSNGYLWIGTQGGGIARFDGREFKVYSTLDGLLGNFVLGLVMDRHDNLWILHRNGVTKYDGISFKKYRVPDSSNLYKYLGRIYEANDTIYTISLEGHLGKIYNDSVYYWDKQIVKDESLRSLHQAPGGELCFYVAGSDFIILKDGKKITFSADSKPGDFFLMFNHGDEVWGWTESGMYKLEISKRRLEKLPFSTRHMVLYYDQVNNIFWTTDKANLYKETVDGGEVKQDTILKDIAIGKVLRDSEDNVWFASDGRGLFKYYFQDFDRCASDNIRSVMGILVDHEGASWIGTMTSGLWKIKKGKITSYEGKVPNAIHSIKEGPDNSIWVATNRGLGKYSKELDQFKWFTVNDGLCSSNVLSVEFDGKNGMWVGTSRGVAYFDGNSFVKCYSVEEGLNTSMVWAVSYLPALKTLFVGNEFGINTIKEGKVDHPAIPELENTVVLSLNPYRDSLELIGTGGAGVIVYDPLHQKKKFITTRDGLTSDFIYFVAQDTDDKIWIGMEKGISRIKLNERLEITENLHFDYDNGLTGVETNQNAFYIDEDHKYFGLIDGLYEFNDLSKSSRKSFDLHLTDVEILYGEYSIREYSDSLMGFFKIPEMPVLPSDKNHITFHFNRVDKRYPKSVKFKYFLQNFDKTWSLPSSATQVTYSNLPPGDYCFRVSATNNEGSWSDNKIAYAFTIQTPFYQTASFIAGIIIFVAGSITLLMYLRVRQRVKKMIDTERIRMRELEGLRKEIARDFHDEMGNQLSRIINYISLLKLNGNGTSNGNGTHIHQADLYSKVEESAKFLYTGTRDFIWSIDPVNDELSKLFIHIRDFGVKLFEEKNIEFRAYDEVKERIKLPNGFSREANLIFKEVMTNAFKYSEAKNTRLSLTRSDDDSCKMVFEDDGVGFNTTQIQKSNGLKNIRDRAERIGAFLRIESERNKGACITLEFKLNKTSKYGAAL